MITEKTGWALKTQGLGESMLLFHTDDGGRHWKDVTPAQYGITATYDSLDSPLPLLNIFFLDGNTVWALGWHLFNTTKTVDTLLHTANAGLSWDASPFPLPSDYSPVTSTEFIDTTITFRDALNGWILLHLTQHTIPDAVALFHTVDGGKVWQRVYDDGKVVSLQAPSPTPPGKLPLYANNDATMALFKDNGLDFRDAVNGWIPDGSLLYATHDAGQTWQEVPAFQPPPSLPPFQTRWPFAPTFFTPVDGILPIDYNPAGIVIYVTHDGGANWTATSPVNAFGIGVFTGNFVDMRHGWTTDGRFLYATSDSGQTWTTIVPDVSLAHILQLEFVSATTGWVILAPDTGPTQVLQTTDGGQTWTPVNL